MCSSKHGRFQPSRRGENCGVSMKRSGSQNPTRCDGGMVRLRVFTLRAMGTAALGPLVGCAVGPKYHPAQVAVPATYHAPLVIATTAPAQNLSQWWRLCHDHQLDPLFQQAIQAHDD